MTYTILSAQYANADNTAAVVMTKEAAAVLVSQADTPELWQTMLDTVTPAAFVPAPTPTQTPEEKLAEFLRSNPDVAEMINA